MNTQTQEAVNSFKAIDEILDEVEYYVSDPARWHDSSRKSRLGLQSMIEKLISEQATQPIAADAEKSAGVWVNALDRLPEKPSNARYNDKPGILVPTTGGCMFQGFNEGWGYSENEPGLFYVEWLDEYASQPKGAGVSEATKYEGVLLGLKICKEMFAQGQLNHENIYENEVYYKELLQNIKNDSSLPSQEGNTN